ncbi:MAG: NADH-quinone oxidoreductase subunit C [Candidatus Aenigmarchaeota archaeon]|nr:NADH-quinone oxidoreductase subunit C [Candidatus Aenigmarchaeota archaeon]
MDFQKLGKITATKSNAIDIEVPFASLHKQIAKLRLSGFYRISTITGIDTGKEIEIIYHISNEIFTINIKTKISRNNPSIETIVDYFPGAALYEREVAEMLGIRIKGNLKPKNIFLDDASPKAPLRKKKNEINLKN